MDFLSAYAHGFARVAACTVPVAVGDPATNAATVLEQARECHDEGVAVAVFPELCLTGYAIDDLVLQDALLDAVHGALDGLVRASVDLFPVLVVGAPLRQGHRLLNCAVVVHRGEVLGVTPKSALPTYREFYERRHYAPGDDRRGTTIEVAGREVPCGPDLLFVCDDVPGLVLHAEVCEDMWVPVPPSAEAALAGASVLVNLSGSPITVARADDRRLLVRSRLDALPGGVRLRRRRPGGVHHRPVLGRPDDGLRVRGPAGGDRALPGRPAPHGGRRRPRPDPPAAAAPGHARRQPTHPRGAYDALPPRRLHPRAARRRRRPASSGRALPVRARRRRPARPGLLRGLLHPGQRSRAAAQRDRRPRRRHRSLGRPRLHPRADRRRAGDGPARPPPQRRPRHHDARLRDRRGDQGPRRAPQPRPRGALRGDRHPAGLRADAARPRPPVLRRRARLRRDLRERPGRACAPTTSSGWPTTAAASCSAPATCPSWPWAGARTAWATR